MSWITLYRKRPSKVCARQPFKPALEGLEQRWVPYATSLYSWCSANISYSFMPDGTNIEGSSSSLFSELNASHSTAAWQREFAEALQTWANVTNLNFHMVSDDGSDFGTTGSTQGDSRFGDIRLGMKPLDGYIGYAYYPSTVGTKAGDIFLDPNDTYKIGTNVDLYSVLLHEAGHALGLKHGLTGTVMNSSLTGVYTGLSSDDIAGIQSKYGVRTADAYDNVAANNTLSSASTITVSSGGTANFSADLTSLTDVDYYKLTAPGSFNGTLTVAAKVSGLSLMAPKLQVYDAAFNLIGSASVGSAYGTDAAVQLTGLSAGQTYYVMVDGATADVFGMGAYKLDVAFGGVSEPAPEPSPTPTLSADRFESNNSFSTARNFGMIYSTSQTGLSIHNSTDVDYFTFRARSTTTYQISTAFKHADGNLDLAIYDSSQQLIATSSSLDDNESLQVSLTYGQTYYVKVYGVSGATNSYDLSIAKVGGTTGGNAKGGKGHGVELGHGSYWAGDADLLSLLDHDHDHGHAGSPQGRR